MRLGNRILPNRLPPTPSWNLLWLEVFLDPVEGGGEAEDAHEGSGGFLIAGCDGAPFLEARPQALDAVAIVVDPARAGHGRLVALGRDRRPGALVPDELAERVRGIAFVADDPSRDIRQAIDQILGQGEFVGLTWSQNEADRPPGSIKALVP